MDVLHPRCCGLDVHKSSISACVLLREAGRVQKHQRRFGAMTQDLHELAEWLRQFRVTQVAMESSGVYWKPVWNILERQVTVVLANAQHIKNVPGRKTDQKMRNGFEPEPRTQVTSSIVAASARASSSHAGPQ
jgi:transposase